MLRIKKILYPTDFSACAGETLAYAMDLAQRHHAMLHVLNVGPPLGGEHVREAIQAVFDEDEFYGQLRDDAYHRMQAALSAYEDAHVVTKRFYTHSPAPGEAIIEHVNAEEIDLVVMGTHGRRGLRRMLLGSVAQEVVQRSSCPVLTVRTSEQRNDAELTFKRVLAPLDLSMHSINALAYAKEVAALYGVSLDLLHVVDPTLNLAIYEAGLKDRSRVEADIEKVVRKKLEWLAGEVRGPDVETVCHIVSGYAVQEIIEFATSYASDLIVIASHGLTGLEHFLMGSVAERVVRMAPCPVFITKPFGKSLLSHDGEHARNVLDQAVTIPALS